jgi:hypothetical protein
MAKLVNHDQSPGSPVQNRIPTPLPVTSSAKTAPGTDPRIRQRIQIGMFRTIRVDHTNCLQVAIKRKKPKDLSGREREECGRGEGGVLYTVYMRDRGGGGREECGVRSSTYLILFSLQKKNLFFLMFLFTDHLSHQHFSGQTRCEFFFPFLMFLFRDHFSHHTNISGFHTIKLCKTLF